MSQFYSVGEFAQLAGVTVRTLHYYDEAGLLTPRRHKHNQRRQYHTSDLLRLQQILTLKHLGFSLQDIEAMLSNPAYDVREGLTMQKAAMEARVLELQRVVYALSRTLALMDASGENQMDWAAVTEIIRSVSALSRAEWARAFFPPDAMQWLAGRAVHMPPDYLAQSAKAWEDLYADFRQHMHLPPDHPDVQALAARMHTLGALFTGDNPDLEAGLSEMYRDVSGIPDAFRVTHDQALQDFMQRALAVYRNVNL